MTGTYLQRPAARAAGLIAASAAALALAAAPAAGSAALQTWQLDLADPARPGRQITALLLGPPAPAPPCPVAVIGHATVTDVEHYRYLADPLARGGWLVALPTTENGLPGDQAALAADMLLLARALRDRAPDLPPDVPAAAGGGFALLGHSLGGGAAVLAAAAALPGEVAALAALAPQERPRPSMIRQAALVAAPTLVLSGEHDCMTPPAEHQTPLYANLAGALKVHAMLLGGGHCAFAGEPEPCTGAEALCAQDLPATAQQDLARELVQPWLAWLVQGQPAGAAGFRAAAAGPGVHTVAEGLVYPVAEAPAARLQLLGGNPGAGVVRWALTAPQGAAVRVEVVDLRGRRLRPLAVAPDGAGPQTAAGSERLGIAWDGRDDAGRRVPAGVYLLRVDVDGRILCSRCVRLD